MPLYFPFKWMKTYRFLFLLLFTQISHLVYSQERYELFTYKGYLWELTIEQEHSYPLIIYYISSKNNVPLLKDSMTIDNIINTIIENDTLVPIITTSTYADVFYQLYGFYNELEINSYFYYNNLDTPNNAKKKIYEYDVNHNIRIIISSTSIYGIFYKPNIGNKVLNVNTSHGLDFSKKYKNAKLCLPISIHATN